MAQKYRTIVEHCTQCGVVLDDRDPIALDTWCDGCDRPLCNACDRALDGLCSDCEEEATP